MSRARQRHASPIAELALARSGSPSGGTTSFPADTSATPGSGSAAYLLGPGFVGACNNLDARASNFAGIVRPGGLVQTVGLVEDALFVAGTNRPVEGQVAYLAGADQNGGLGGGFTPDRPQEGVPVTGVFAGGFARNAVPVVRVRNTSGWADTPPRCVVEMLGPKGPDPSLEPDEVFSGAQYATDNSDYFTAPWNTVGGGLEDGRTHILLLKVDGPYSGFGHLINNVNAALDHGWILYCNTSVNLYLAGGTGNVDFGVGSVGGILAPKVDYCVVAFCRSGNTVFWAVSQPDEKVQFGSAPIVVVAPNNTCTLRLGAFAPFNESTWCKKLAWTSIARAFTPEELGRAARSVFPHPVANRTQLPDWITKDAAVSFNWNAVNATGNYDANFNFKFSWTPVGAPTSSTLYERAFNDVAAITRDAGPIFYDATGQPQGCIHGRITLTVPAIQQSIRIKWVGKDTRDFDNAGILVEEFIAGVWVYKMGLPLIGDGVPPRAQPYEAWIDLSDNTVPAAPHTIRLTNANGYQSGILDVVTGASGFAVQQTNVVSLVSQASQTFLDSTCLERWVLAGSSYECGHDTGIGGAGPGDIGNSGTRWSLDTWLLSHVPLTTRITNNSAVDRTWFDMWLAGNLSMQAYARILVSDGDEGTIGTNVPVKVFLFSGILDYRGATWTPAQHGARLQALVTEILALRPTWNVVIVRSIHVQYDAVPINGFPLADFDAAAAAVDASRAMLNPRLPVQPGFQIDNQTLSIAGVQQYAANLFDIA